MFNLRQFAAIVPEWYVRLHYHDELDSTNDEAHRLASEGGEHGLVVLADHQRAGRGRRGASWVSEPGDGLLFSVVIRPDSPKSKWSRMALAAGVGIVTALNERWAAQAQVKWPNDIYIRGRKCGGILAEASEDFVIVGVGLNVFATPPADHSTIPAISLGEVVGETLSREMVLAVVLDGLMREIDACEVGFKGLLLKLREICYLTGKEVRFVSGEEIRAGEVAGIDAQGNLLVNEKGVITPYSQAAEIRIIGR